MVYYSREMAMCVSMWYQLFRFISYSREQAQIAQFWYLILHTTMISNIKIGYFFKILLMIFKVFCQKWLIISWYRENNDISNSIPPCFMEYFRNNSFGRHHHWDNPNSLNSPTFVLFPPQVDRTFTFFVWKSCWVHCWLKRWLCQLFGISSSFCQ